MVASMLGLVHHGQNLSTATGPPPRRIVPESSVRIVRIRAWSGLVRDPVGSGDLRQYRLRPTCVDGGPMTHRIDSPQIGTEVEQLGGLLAQVGIGVEIEPHESISPVSIGIQIEPGG